MNLDEFRNLDGFKAAFNGDISVNILNLIVGVCLPYIKNIITLPTEQGYFSDKLKLA